MSEQAPQPARFTHRYLRVADLHALRHQVFAPKRRVEGRYAGRHATPQRGHAIEFNDYREYVPGDALNDIDWKVFGRSDRLYIKQFEHQADMTVNLLIDASASMSYAGSQPKTSFGSSWLSRVSSAGNKLKQRDKEAVLANPSKYDQACLMAAAIAFLTIKQQDRVAFAHASTGLQNFLPPAGSFRHLHQVLTHMEHQPEGQAGLADAIESFARRTHRRGLFLLFSDLMEDPADVTRALSLLTHRGMEVIVFHTLHRDELTLPPGGEAVFIDSETGQRVRINTDETRAAYRDRMKQRIDTWARLFRAQGMDHNVVTTDTPYRKALEGYLFNRAAMA